jgi:hypothetical protein
MLGSQREFAAVSGRCSAAGAECLRRVGDEKLYLSRAATGEEFCPNQLGLSRAKANRIIRNPEECGPDYFEVAQLTRITPEVPRDRTAIREKSIHVEGQAIALIPENCDRVAEAVVELRAAAAPAAPPSSAHDRIAAIERRCEQFTTDYHELAASSLTVEEKSQMRAALTKTLLALHPLEVRR